MTYCTTKKIKFVKIPVDTINYVISLEGMTSFKYQLWLFLYSLDPFGDRYVSIPSPTELAKQFNVDFRTVKRAIEFLKKHNLIPEWCFQSTPRKCKNLEKRVRDRLRKELDGLVEVSTAVGRIDLLTDTEIIEVKQFKDWKTALGQILVYSGLYPEHKKRIHLFGTKSELKKLPDIAAACLSFDVLVTSEVLEEVTAHE